MSRRVTDARKPLAEKVRLALNIILDAWTAAYVVSTGRRVRIRRIEENAKKTRFVLDTDQREEASPEQKQLAWLCAPEWKKRSPLKPEECAIICESTPRGIRIAIERRDKAQVLWAPDDPA